MNALSITRTDDTPEVRFDPLQGQLHISGRSFSENSGEFFYPIIQWVESYLEMPVSESHLSIDLDLVDEASLKYILEILTMLSTLKSDKKVKVSWLYEKGDDETREIGESLEPLVEVNFEVTQKSGK